MYPNGRSVEKRDDISNGKVGCVAQIFPDLEVYLLASAILTGAAFARVTKAEIN